MPVKTAKISDKLIMYQEIFKKFPDLHHSLVEQAGGEQL